MCREGKSICASAKAYRMSKATLQNRFKMQEEGKTLVGSGRKNDWGIKRKAISRLH